jgi:hypothetical protein
MLEMDVKADHSGPFGLSLSKPRAALRQAQRERLEVAQAHRSYRSG